MRWVCFVILVVACKFTPPSALSDAPIDTPIDVPIDTPIDMSTGGRTGNPSALWTFTETSGNTVGDSVPGNPITLTLSPTSMVTQAVGGLTFDARSTAVSAPTPHINAEVKSSGAVTLEAWVTPANDTQGGTSYSVIAAVSVSIMLRNIGLEQRGNTWAARARTGATTVNADPEIVRTAVDLTKPTHLVVVADATKRVLYVNGLPYMSMPIGNGTMTSWDPNYKLRFGDEDSADRHWLGTLWLVAIYDEALSDADIMQNFLAGHDCSSC